MVSSGNLLPPFHLSLLIRKVSSNESSTSRIRHGKGGLLGAHLAASWPHEAYVRHPEAGP